MSTMHFFTCIRDESHIQILSRVVKLCVTAFVVGHTVNKWQMTVLLPVPKVLNSSKTAFLLPRKSFYPSISKQAQSISFPKHKLGLANWCWSWAGWLGERIAKCLLGLLARAWRGQQALLTPGQSPRLAGKAGAPFYCIQVAHFEEKWLC